MLSTPIYPPAPRRPIRACAERPSLPTRRSDNENGPERLACTALLGALKAAERRLAGRRSLYLPAELAICRSTRCVNGRTIAIGSRASQKLKSR
jgi:hypothetical protein